MAEKLKTYAFAASGRRANYPWDKWFDGGIWKLTFGEDFNCKMAGFRSGAYQKAREHGGLLRASIDGDSLIIQFLPGNPDKK